MGRNGVDALERGEAEAYWGNGMRVAIGYNFAALTTTERLINERPEAAAAAVRAIVQTQKALKADPSLATQVGNRIFRRMRPS